MDGTRAASVKPLKYPDLLPVENPDLCTVQEDGNDDDYVYLDLSTEAERMTKFSRARACTHARTHARTHAHTHTHTHTHTYKLLALDRRL